MKLHQSKAGEHQGNVVPKWAADDMEQRRKRHELLKPKLKKAKETRLRDAKDRERRKRQDKKKQECPLKCAEGGRTYGPRQQPHFVLYTDGAAEPNPGPTAIGVVVENLAGQVLATLDKAMGEGTCNTAEMEALSEGLDIALERGARSIMAYTDSQLLVFYLLRRRPSKIAHLEALRVHIHAKLAKLEGWVVKQIPRERNERAHALASKALGVAHACAEVPDDDSDDDKRLDTEFAAIIGK